MKNLLQTDRVNLRFYENNKLIILTKSKVASRTCDSYFRSTPIYTNGETDIDLEYIDGDYLPNTNIKSDLNNRYFQLIDITKNKKDILLLYRNPLNRLISGIIQDTINLELSEPNFLIRDIIKKNCSNSVYDISNAFNIVLNGNVNNIDNSLRDDVDLIILHLIKVLVNDINFNLSLQRTSHTEPYLHVYDYFITEKFDTRKVSLINIDAEKNNLNTILSDYNLINLDNPTLFRNSNSYIIKLLINYINSNNINVNQTFYQYLYAEQYFYNKFENSKFNILNK